MKLNEMRMMKLNEMRMNVSELWQSRKQIHCSH